MQILIPNLNRRPDKKFATMGALLSHGFQQTDFTFIEADDSEQYDSFQDQIDTFIRKWDPYWKHNLGGLVLQRPLLGSISTYLGILKRIVLSGEPGILMLDDHYLANKVPFDLITKENEPVIINLTDDSKSDDCLLFHPNAALHIYNSLISVCEPRSLILWKHCFQYYNYQRSFEPYAFHIGPKGTFISDIGDKSDAI